jgi:SAM-dependent methyltransferase
MPEVDENRANWTAGWQWPEQGDEWSAWWGGTAALWNAAILPRIRAWVPAGTILEIAPGFGRWTGYLASLADRVVAVDLTERCVVACRERFAGRPEVEVHVNDGRSLPMVADGSVDFAFSFDSLVHAESDVLGAYMGELARVLRPDGVAFVHHSNIGAYPRQTRLARRVRSPRLHGALTRRGVLINMPAWRAESVTAESVAAQAADAGLACISQEKVNWEYGRQLIDAFTVVTPRGSRWERPLEVVENPRFTDEAARARRRYAPPPGPSGRGASSSRPTRP